MEKFFDKVAGIDIGSEEIFISIEGQPVSRFSTFSSGIQAAISYLKEHQIQRVAMEATGIYWCSLYDQIEASGIEACLVNPRQSKSVPGRKSDVKDCEWIQQLFSYGLLRKSFIPQDGIRELRTYVRYREQKIEDMSKCILRMQKALIQMNIRLSNVISNIMGVSGRRIIEAILGGQRDPRELTLLCEKSILRNKQEQVEESLKGIYAERHLFELQQEMNTYRFYESQLLDCDHKIEQALIVLEKANDALPIQDEHRPKPANKSHAPNIPDLHLKMLACFGGINPCQLPGISDYTTLRLLAEIGNDFSKWPDEKHFTAWLGLAPGKNQSGKKNKRSRPLAATRASLIFRQSAQSLLRSKDCALGEFARRIRAKKGPQIAIKATARKMAVSFFQLMKHGQTFIELGVQQYKERYRNNIINHLKRTMNKFDIDVYELGLVT